MGRRAKSPKGKTDAKRPLARMSPKTDDARVRDLEKLLAESLEREKAKDRALTEALERQRASGEILAVLSSTHTDVQPVFDVIVQSAARLCHAASAAVFLTDGRMIYEPANFGGSPEALAATRARFPRQVDMESTAGIAILTRAVFHVPDTEDPSVIEHLRQSGRLVGFQSAVTVPMMREGEAIGAVLVARGEPGRFTDEEVGLLKTFADQAVIAIENVRLFNETKESLDQQSATSEVLRVISTSPTDIQPVFDAIVARATSLCDALFSALFRFDGERLHFVAHENFPAEAVEAFTRDFPARPEGMTIAQAVVERRVVNVADVLADPTQSAQALARAQALGYRSLLAVPMFREGEVIGTIAVARAQVGAFTDTQIDLLKTFADQAVIAIENVRLFKELQSSNGELRVALEQQTATGEILKVISSSPTDEKPVFDAIARSSVRLCGAAFSVVAILDADEMLHLVASEHVGTEGRRSLAAAYPMRPDRGQLAGRAILDRAVVHVPDVTLDPEYIGATLGNRATLSVPMLRKGTPIGTITIGRFEPVPFTDQQIELLKTFADQAVIAIENVRLFTELQEKNQALTTAHAQVSEALEQQTATSEILRVISSSPTDAQPVFDTIVDNAQRLLRGHDAVLARVVGDHLYLAASNAVTGAAREATRNDFPRPICGHPSTSSRAIRHRVPVMQEDLLTNPEVSPAGRELARVRGFRSVLSVPLLRAGEAIGAINVSRATPGPFTDEEVALLQTFAGQAVIAIENVRLFTELQTRTAELTRSVGELTALGEVSRALSSTLDLETVLQTIVMRANEIARTAGCTIWEYDNARQEFRLRASDYPDEADAAALQAVARVTTIRKGQGVTTLVMEGRQPVQIPDITVGGAYESPIRRPLVEAGHRALLGVPLLSEDEVIGVLAVTRKTPGEFEPEIVRLLSTFATQSALAIQNARLFLEIEDKSRQLEAASRHKSEFLANMSHELRTPLNAILGFSEVLADGMFGEINDKQAEYLRDILESGRHLLSLINDILDLSKIEAGRIELEPTDFDLPAAIDTALTLVRERAGRRGITLGREIDEHVGLIRGDERKVKQVLLNLLSNAVKFTPEGGRIDVRAAVSDGMVEVSVADTGVGIAPEDQETVFEEFRQVGTADTKVEGTGLGLALSRKFIELHGGRIWVTSQVGRGSTFTFTLPVRHGQ